MYVPKIHVPKIHTIDMGRLYNKAFEYRQKFDYVDFAIPEEDMVIEYIEKAELFVNSINEYLKS